MSAATMVKKAEAAHRDARDLRELVHRDAILNLDADGVERLRDRIEALADSVLDAFLLGGGERVVERLEAGEGTVKGPVLSEGRRWRRTSKTETPRLVRAGADALTWRI